MQMENLEDDFEGSGDEDETDFYYGPITLALV